MYSDGITECEDARGDEFGEERLVELLYAQRSQPLEEIDGTLNGVLLEFSAGLPKEMTKRSFFCAHNANDKE